MQFYYIISVLSYVVTSLYLLDEKKLQICNQDEELTHKPVQMGDSDNFSADIVIQSIYSIGVDETISNPDASLHTIFYFATNLFTIKTRSSCYLI